MRLRGSSLGKLKQTSAERRAEIDKLKNVRDVMLADLEVDLFTGDVTMRVVVDNFHDYIKLMQPWPRYSFKSGVTPEATPIEDIQVVIVDVDTTIVVDSARKNFRECETIYGLCNFNRVQNRYKRDTKMVRASVKTLFNLIDVLRYHIYIDGKRYGVIPSINHAKVCQNCGNLRHGICMARPRCLICSSPEHPTDVCMSPPHCINCHAKGATNISHRCDTEECPTLAEQTKKLNKYLIDILIGEGLIKEWREILTVDMRIKESDTTKTELEHVVEEALTKHKHSYDQKIGACMNELDAVKIKINTVEAAQHKLTQDMEMVQKEIGAIKNAQIEHHNENTVMHTNTANLLQELIESNKNNKRCSTVPNRKDNGLGKEKPIRASQQTSLQKKNK